MQQMDLFAPEPKAITVTELTRGLRRAIEAVDVFQNLWVQGEVSNFSRPQSGHWYFTLKDRDAALPCVMWRSTAELQAQVPKNGDQIEVHGGLSIYEAQGRYQLYVDEIRSAGEGSLYQKFIELKNRLEAEGLFARSRSLPAWPQRIGIVTSATGAALQDVLHTLERRYPLAEVVLAPTQVQGPSAAVLVAEALTMLDQFAQPELILLVRGGGSLEDLAAFNSEIVARAIVRTRAVVVSGVGHETDVTIADFAADLRAPTPTAAAELATPDLQELQARLAALHSRLQRQTPIAKINRALQQLDELSLRSGRALAQRTRWLRATLQGHTARLQALSPLAVLERGYAVVRAADGTLVRQASQVQPGATLDVRVQRGHLNVEVKETKDD
ncbi:MAG TPA: exodeoxyribonuclease VII large subunit [Anaerolineales bacterium]|nr:exodeoxyribonuclease VII large subunit [Anaerolineales bacterium]HRQ91957.1 exodeoxyribonuclease VII large subunit [Anaerolineales bacterium]